MKKIIAISLTTSSLLCASQSVDLGDVAVTDTPIAVASDGIEPSRATSLPKSASLLEEVITRDTIESLNPSDLFDLLQYASSVFIQRQGRKAPAWVKVRGNRALGIIIDGVYVPAAVTSRILATLPVEAIERIRIVRDSAALNLGPLPNGTGGLLGGDDAGYLVIETRLPSKASEGIIALQAENFGRSHLSAVMGMLEANGYLSLIADYDKSEGDPDWTTGFDKRSLYARGGFFVGDWSFDLQGFVTDSTTELQRSSSPGVSDAKWSYDPMTIGELSGRLAYSSSHGVTSLSYAHSDLDAKLQQESWSNPAYHATELQKESFDHLRLDHAMDFNTHTLRAGVEGIRWHTPTGEYFYTGWEKKERTGGIFVQDAWSRGDFDFDAGMRLDKTWQDVGYEQIGAKRVRVEDESLDPVMALALGSRWNYDANAALYLRTRLSTQNSPEVETVDGSTLPSSLRWSFEGGWEHFISPLLRPRVSLYYLDVSDAPYVAGQYTNPADATDIINVYDSSSWHEYGAEVAVAGAIAAWSYQLSYSYNRNSDDTLDNRIPDSTFNGVVKYADGGWEAALGLYYVDSFEAVNKAGTGEAGGYTNVDLTVGYAFETAALRHKVQLYSRNLADDDYESVYGFPSMGRIVGASYRLAF